MQTVLEKKTVIVYDEQPRCMRVRVAKKNTRWRARVRYTVHIAENLHLRNAKYTDARGG